MGVAGLYGSKPGYAFRFVLTPWDHDSYDWVTGLWAPAWSTEELCAEDQLSPGESVTLQKPMVDEIGRFHNLPGQYWCDVVNEVNSPTMAGSDARVELVVLNPN